MNINTFETFVVGRARPKGSMDVALDDEGQPHLSTPLKTKQWENLVATHIKERWDDEPIPKPVGVEAELYFNFRLPKTVSKYERPHPTVVPDLDKLVRAVLDAMTGIVYQDDCQVWRIITDKQYFERNKDREGVKIFLKWG